jgi:hypothetical protein
MEPEETGLTFAERLMFLILALALLIVGAILIFGNIKTKDKSLKEETKVTEKANKEEVKNETVSDDSAKKEEEKPEEDIKNSERPGSTSDTEDSKKSSSDEKSEDNSDTTRPKEEIRDTTNEEQNSTTEPKRSNTPNTRVDDEVLVSTEVKEALPQVPHTKVDGEEESTDESWNLPENIILEAYVGDTIVINKTVVNQNGHTEPAQVTVRKLEGNSYNIIDTANNRFVASKGTYKYYYTHNSITKVATLHVDERATNVSFSPLASFDYVEQDEFTKYELTNMIDNSKGTKITQENNVYVINIEKANKTNYSALLINTGEKIDTINSNTKGIYIGSKYSTLWNEHYDTGTARVIVNMNYINSGETIRLRVNINGVEKTIEVKFIITEKKEEKEELESDPEIIDNKLEVEEKEISKEQHEDVSNPSNKEELPTVSSDNKNDNVEESNDIDQSLDRT